MKTIYYLKTRRLIFSVILLLVGNLSYAQIIKPYSLIYTDNIRGTHAIFGNTMMHIIDNGVPNLTKMNESGLAAGGGVGFSQYGNDQENMQFIDIDGTPQLSLIATGDQWNYSTGNSQPANWPNTTVTGGPGASPLGYGPTGTVATTLTDRRTYYFTKIVNITTAGLSSYEFTLTLDDGAVVYVNGVQVSRINMPNGSIGYSTDASSNIEPEAVSTFSVAAGAPFVNGNNTIQVEVHTSANNETGTDDLFFDLNLKGIYAGQTANSSSADFTLPSGTNTIKFARLYWGGRIDNSIVTAAPDTLRKVKIRKGASAYSQVFTAAANVDTYATTTTDKVYQAFIDITAFIQNSGTQTYTVADIPLTAGSVSGGGHFGGWFIVVAYENPTLPYKSVRIYDGYAQVGSSSTQSITLNGLNVPNNPLVNADAKMSTMSWEGDANLFGTTGNPAGDFLKINGTTFSNTMNPATNMWNGSITKNGANVTTKSPNYVNQMGLDIDEADVGVGYGILPGASSVDITFGTEQDQYFPTALGFSISMKDPTIVLDKAVQAFSGSTIAVQPNELLTYTISGVNNGPGTAYNCVVTDTLPGNVIYSPGTLEIISSPGIPAGIQTDANDGDHAFKATNGTKHYVKFFIGTGATNSAGGQIAINQTYSLRFKANASANPGLIVNTARINAVSESNESFVDDGTATIGSAGGPTPVKLTLFSGKLQGNNSVLLNWETANEINSDYFAIERSDDGLNFTQVGYVKATGTTDIHQYYKLVDVLNTASKIVYYRLKTVDIGGEFAYSKTIAVRLSGNLADSYVVYPNPFISDIKVSVNADKDEDVSFRILTIEGKTAVNRVVALQKGQNIVVLKDLGQLQAGSYILEMVTEKGKVSRMLIKN